MKSLKYLKMNNVSASKARTSNLDNKMELETGDGGGARLKPMNIPITDFTLRPGLVNNKNDCFMNSVMQCLAVSPFIHEFIAKYKKDDADMINLITKYNLNRLKTDVLPSVIDKLLETRTDIPENERLALTKVGKKCADFYIYVGFREIIMALDRKSTRLNSSHT